MSRRKVLFVCTLNRMRSPTAAAVFRDYPGIEARSAGIGYTSEHYLDDYLLRWADIVFVMEKRHKEHILKTFGKAARYTRIICLSIPDEYNYMDDELIELLRIRVPPFLMKEQGDGSQGRG